MSVTIRLSVTGKKHQKSYRLVVANTRSKRDGKPIEELGYYNPLQKPPQIKINKERLEYWLKQGAKISAQVKKLQAKEKSK